MSGWRASRGRSVALGALIAFMLLAVVFPLFELGVRSLTRAVPGVDGATRFEFAGLANFREYFGKPALRASLFNTLTISAASSLIATSIAFLYAFALTHTRVRGRSFFRIMIMLPVFAPTLLFGLSLVYLFGRKGLVTTGFNGWMAGLDIGLYGRTGIIIAEVIYTLPAAFLILYPTLRNLDARLYEAARSLGESLGGCFRRVTLPGARHALLGAAITSFTLAFTDFGAPKVVGGNHPVLAVEVYKQVVGQNNLPMGATVSLLLLFPAVLAFIADRWLKRQAGVSQGARPTALSPRKEPVADGIAFAYCTIVSLVVALVVLVGVYASFVEAWPYRLNLSLRHYQFGGTSSRGLAPFFNSLQLAGWTAVIGTAAAFAGAYLVEKGRGLDRSRALFQFLATLPLALPGLVLGISYILFFNRPGWVLPGGVTLANPFAGLYGSMALLVLVTVVHFFTAGYLTLAASLRQLDNDFETAAESLAIPVWKLVGRVTLPVSLPALVEVFGYLFVSAMTTVSAIIFLYSSASRTASVAVVSMDDAGDPAAAAALCTLILATSIAVRVATDLAAKRLWRRSQSWRAV
jgi:iron(III) transport system permease protein